MVLGRHHSEQRGLADRFKHEHGQFAVIPQPLSLSMSNDFLVGLDWAEQTHVVRIIDAAGSVLDRFEVTHDRDGWLRCCVGRRVGAIAFPSSSSGHRG